MIRYGLTHGAAIEIALGFSALPPSPDEHGKSKRSLVAVLEAAIRDARAVIEVAEVNNEGIFSESSSYTIDSPE